MEESCKMEEDCDIEIIYESSCGDQSIAEKTLQLLKTLQKSGRAIPVNFTKFCAFCQTYLETSVEDKVLREVWSKLDYHESFQNNDSAKRQIIHIDSDNECDIPISHDKYPDFLSLSPGSPLTRTGMSDEVIIIDDDSDDELKVDNLNEAKHPDRSEKIEQVGTDLSTGSLLVDDIVLDAFELNQDIINCPDFRETKDSSRPSKGRTLKKYKRHKTESANEEKMRNKKKKKKRDKKSRKKKEQEEEKMEKELGRNEEEAFCQTYLKTSVEDKVLREVWSKLDYHESFQNNDSAKRQIIHIDSDNECDIPISHDKYPDFLSLSPGSPLTRTGMSDEVIIIDDDSDDELKVDNLNEAKHPDRSEKIEQVGTDLSTGSLLVDDIVLDAFELNQDIINCPDFRETKDSSRPSKGRTLKKYKRHKTESANEEKMRNKKKKKKRDKKSRKKKEQEEEKMEKELGRNEEEVCDELRMNLFIDKIIEMTMPSIMEFRDQNNT